MRRIPSIYSAQRGLTLVEIIVVLVILSILITFLTGGLFKSGEKAKARLNDIQMQKLQQAINQYNLMYNTLPPSLDALVNCNDQTGQSCVPVAEEETLKDAWGSNYQYSVDGGRSYSIRSLGADRREGGTGVDSDVVRKGP